MLDMVHSVQARFNLKLKIVGILLTMYQCRPQLCQSARESAGEVYRESFHVFDRPDEAYEKIFQQQPPSGPAAIHDLPLDKLVPFFTADIDFKPYPPSRLKAFAEQLSEEGLMVRIIVRSMGDNGFEILAGHNRANAAKLAGWTEIPAEVVEADDARAIVIATSTNLIQRQELSIEVCSVIGAPVNKATMQHIIRCCPPPTASRQVIFQACREARAAAYQRPAAPPKKISFDRRRFAPYLDKLGSDQELEKLFLEFLQERVR